MPTVSFDRQSFTIDRRRVWLVSGTIDYTGIPRGLWRDHLRFAREAGLNCVETPVVWSAHERKPGELDFEGDLDLRAFIKTTAEEGLYCILRVGPYVGNEYAMGGLPAYLSGQSGLKDNRIRLRENEPLFLEAVDRYYRAVMEQVRDLQVGLTGPSGSSSYPYAPGRAAGGYQGEGGGPIILMQVEHAWESHDPDQTYLDRLVSMLRQHGCTVPLTNANNLWQPVEGTIDTWRGETSLPAMMRQLASVQPDAPAMVSHLDIAGLTPETLAYRLAGLTGVGAQFNLKPDETAVIHGFKPKSHHAIKRLCTFASHFGNILANSEAKPTPTIKLNETDHATALLHQRSSQGELVMLIKSESDKTQHTELMLPNGLTLEVPHADQRTAWVLLNASLGGRTTLDYTSLSPWALIDRKLLVVFGPAGAPGDISIDGEHHHVTVPTGKTPLVIEAGPLQLAVLNHEQIDAAYRGPQGLVIGCNGFDTEGNPKPLPGWGTLITVSLTGKLKRKRVTGLSQPTAPRLSQWQTRSIRMLFDGSDTSYQPIDGPTALCDLDSSLGYGWYRFRSAKKPAEKVLPHAGGDRLHLYQQGKLAALIGIGEGAEAGVISLNLSGDSVVLADGLMPSTDLPKSAFAAKGISDHFYHVKPIKAGKPTINHQPAGDPFAVLGYVPRQRAGAGPMSQALSWTIKPEARRPILFEIDALGQPCVITINGEPVSYYPGGKVRLLLDPAQLEAMTGGKNEIKLELLEPLMDGVSIDEHIRFYQTTGLATPKENWAFAPFKAPDANDEAWQAIPKTLPSQPIWFRNTFSVTTCDHPLFLEVTGMSKGLAILNGHVLGRYWHQTREGKAVGQPRPLYLPEPWLNTDAPNELLLFDEHGKRPGKCRLTYSH